MLKVNIKKKLGNFDLSINFNVENDIIGLLGASGCGKSMTLKCIAGIEKPDEGYIELNNKVLYDSTKNINLTPQERRIGYMFQNYALFPQMTIYKNILVSVNNKYDKKDKEKRVDDILKKLNIDGLQNKYPNEISGGQQQRVAIARIIVNEPEFLLLDEPFSALDAFLKWNLAKELKEIIVNFGKGVVFVSHNMSEVYFLCKNAIVINEGREIEKNTVENIINNPKDNITKKLIQFSNMTTKDIDKFLEK